MDDLPSKRPQLSDPQSFATDSRSPSQRSQPEASNHSGVNARREESHMSRDAHENPSVLHNEDGDDDDDYTSSSGSSSSDDSEGDISEGEGEGMVRVRKADGINGAADGDSIPHISTRTKPSIRRFHKDEDLLTRLSTFLPQMKSANDDLQRDIEAGRGKDIRLDDADEDCEDGQYIEMNLGLGVLEEKHSGADQPSPDKEAAESEHQEQNPPRQTNVLNRLMGKDKEEEEKPSIQDITE